MTSLRPDGVHILAADGTVLRANLKDQKAGRARARDLSRSGRPVMLFDPRDDYRRLYVGGRQDEDDSQGVAAMRSGAFKPVDRVVTERVAPSRTHDDGGVRSQQTSSSRRARDGEGMDWTDLVEALGDRRRAAPAGRFSADSPGARERGVYGWWADAASRRLIEETLQTDAASLIYVGKAGGGKSRETFETRVLGKHLNGSIRNSTLRWSLTAILMETSAFAAEHSDPQVVRRSPTLSAWMREHLQVAIIPVDPELVKDAERAVIAYYDPPLNGRRERLTELRRRLKPARDAVKRPPLQ